MRWRAGTLLVEIGVASVSLTACVNSNPAVAQHLGTVSVPVSPKTATPIAPREVESPRFQFASVEQACEREEGAPPENAPGAWLVDAVCFRPEDYGSPPDQNGLWMIYPFAHSGDPTAEMASLTTDWVVLWVWPDGHTAEGPVFRSNSDNYLEGQSNVPEIGILRHLFDFDGDGRDELMLPVRQLQHASEGPRHLWVLTLNEAGEVTEYFTAPGEVVWSYDHDGDGRPDILIDPDGTYTENEYPVHSSVESSGWKLAHSLPDGRFSLTDEVAQSYAGE